MRENWEIKTLGEVCEIARGGSPRPIKNFITESEDGIPWIKIGDTEIGGKYICKVKEKIIKEGIKHSRYVEEGDFLLSNSMSFGRPYILKTHGCIHDGWLVLRNYQNSFNSDFLYLLLLSPIVQKQFDLAAHGSTVRNLKCESVQKVQVCFPKSLAEQSAIVEKLDLEFAKIDLLKSNAQKQLDEAKALFQSTLKQLLEPKEGWEEKKMGEVCELSQGLAINAKTKHLLVPKSSVPLLRIMDMKSGIFTQYVDDKLYPAKCLATPDDLIYTRTGSLGLVFTGQYGIIHNNSFKIVLNRELINKKYYMYFVSNDVFKNEIIKIAQRTAQPDITHTLFKAQKIYYPSLQDQLAIVEKLDAISSKIKKLEENYKNILTHCDDLKQAILREIFG